MKYEFDPKHPQDTLGDIASSLDMLACLFAGAGENDLDLNEGALIGLMTQFFAMARAMREVEDHLAEIAMQKARAA